VHITKEISLYSWNNEKHRDPKYYHNALFCLHFDESTSGVTMSLRLAFKLNCYESEIAVI